MRTVWTFHSAGQIMFGRDAIEQLGDIATRLRAKKALIVTDPILEKAGLLERARRPLVAAGLNVSAFTGGEPEPSMKAAVACYDMAKTFQPDVFVGLGGGSNMDLAKLAATLLKHGGSPRDYVGDDKIPGPIFPLICVPTTAGTGSEVSAASVVTDTENHIKVGILSNWLRSSAAVVDPLMTLSCPPKVSADSGIDALTHAIEAYTAVDNADFPLPSGERSVYQGKHPMGDLCAERAITLVGRYLRRAVNDGHDLDAREGMALAALLAGLAFSNVGVALVHAMEYPVGGAVHCSHGAGNGLLLPYVMRFNLPAKTRAYAEIARMLGENVTGSSERAAAEKAVAAVEKLRNDIGVPQRLRDVGIKPEQLRTLAEKAGGIKRILRVNPRSVTVDDIEGIFKEAF
jgi:alcohol dehydrogenase class IV